MSDQSDPNPADLIRRRRRTSLHQSRVRWVEVHRCDSDVGAGLLESHLRAHGLHALVDQRHSGKVTAYSVRVPAEEADAAWAVIQQLVEDGEIELPPQPGPFSAQEVRGQRMGLLIFPVGLLGALLVMWIISRL